MKTNGEAVEAYFGIFGVHTWELWTFMIAFVGISAFMMLGTILTWAGIRFNALTCFNTWFLLPIFLVLVTMAWTIVSFYGVATVMNGGGY